MGALLDRVLDGRSFSRAVRHPSGLPWATRLLPPTDMACGHEDAYTLASDLLVTTKNLSFDHACTETEKGWGRLIFCVHIDGNRVVEVPKVGTFKLAVPSFVAFYQALGVAKRSIWPSGGRETSVMAGFAPEQLPLAVGQPHSVVAALAEMLHLERRSFAWLALPLDTQMELAARALIAPAVHERLLQPYLRLKAQELICLGINRLLSERRLPEPSLASAWSGDGRLERVCQIVRESLGGSLSVRRLAAAVGLSSDALSATFRAAYGVSLPDFILGSRMIHARALLEQTDHGLKQIAFRIGYRHVSNFCAAYKRQFGRTPTETRYGRYDA